MCVHGYQSVRVMCVHGYQSVTFMSPRIRMLRLQFCHLLKVGLFCGLASVKIDKQSLS